MGSGASVLAVHGRIDAILPHHTFELADNQQQHNEMVKNVTHIFAGGHNDRAQFIHSCRVLLSSNGKVSLGDKRFKLVFSRAPQEFRTAEEEDAQMYISIVAVAPDGILAAKIVSERSGRTKLEAFQMFRKTVEMHMHKMLDSVPGPSDHASSSSTAAPMQDEQRNLSAVTLASTILPDEPPTYQEASK